MPETLSSGDLIVNPMISFLAAGLLGCGLLNSAACCATGPPRCEFPEQVIRVDGDPADWAGIMPHVVHGRDHLWFGQGMTPDRWRDDSDLSYRWRGAWSGDRLFFLFEVTDDHVVDAGGPTSYESDCIEIYLDHANRGGRRVTVLDGRADWLARCDPRELMGYELHFLPTIPPRVYLDHTHKYAIDRPQTERFVREWKGEVVSRRTPTGYLTEIGFSVPGVELAAGKTLGVEIGVCDDDGAGRESIMMWTGTKADFWLVMDGYGKITLARGQGGVAPPPASKPIGRLGSGAQVSAVASPDGLWGIQVSGAGDSSVSQARPFQLELWDGTRVTPLAVGYRAFEKKGDAWVGRGTLARSGVRFECEDRWTLAGDELRVTRTVKVVGNAPGGFLSAVTLPLDTRLSWPQVQWFAPGMIYGGFDHLTDVAIGGRAYYRTGDFTVRIREDRLPAPLLAARLPDGRSLAVLDPAPRGETTAADSLDVNVATMTNERFRFGAIGGEEKGDQLAVGFWFPGTEGEVTYRGDTYPGGQLHQWRRRYHPIQDGLLQRYEVAFRFGREASFPECYRNAWRWAWQTLRPQVTPNDIAAARRSIVDVLSGCVVQRDGRAGIPNAVDAMTKDMARADRKAVLGFCGKNLEAAEFLLREATLDSTPRGERLRRQAEAIIASFLQLGVAPPVGEGFNLDDGRPVCAIGNREVHLRSFGDDLKALLRAYEHEREHGRAHPEWLAWCRQFGDWLLTQQRPDGGFPRSWAPGTGLVVSASPNASYNAVVMLALLGQATGEPKYLAAAVRAGEFCWATGQANGAFVGGTIDNPDVLDKEAGTLSLEAYLALRVATGEGRWVRCAQAAADYAETWIYLWNVPIPDDDRNPALGWKHGVPTTGLQLISTGHSLVDAYMAFDVDEFAALHALTGDTHYLDIARLLLHNTKNMLALPGRTHDLGTPGWQQEHWSLAPRRGYGLHRLWLPWVATSQLNGIFGLMDLDASLYRRLTAGAATR